MKKTIDFISIFTVDGEEKSLRHIVYVGFVNPYTDKSKSHFLNNNTMVHHFETMDQAKSNFTPNAVKRFFISANITTN